MVGRSIGGLWDDSVGGGWCGAGWWWLEMMRVFVWRWELAVEVRCCDEMESIGAHLRLAGVEGFGV